MITLLKIVAIVTLTALILVGVGAALVVRWFRKIIKSAVNDGASCPPCRVNPEPEPSPQWRTPDKILQYANEFKALGFEEIGAFTIPEMAGLQILAFVHTGERLYGIIYDHKTIAPTFDIICKFEDQTALSATNSKAGRSLDKRPGHPILWLGDDRVAAVLDAVKQHPQPAARVTVSADGFLPRFKRSYAESMNWRMKKGGVSRDEIRRQTESKGKTINEETLNEVYKNLRKAHITELKRGCLAQYLDELQIPAAEWERLQARAVVVPETLEIEELVETLDEALTLDQEQRHALRQLRKHTGQTALELADEIVIGNVAALGLEKRGEVREPVRAYVLLTPIPEAAAEALSACA
jgi:hypothetical protein